MKSLTSHWLALATTALALLAPIQAARAQEFSLDDLAAQAEFVFRGRVESQTSKWESFEGNRFISTDVVFAILETYKGDPGDRVTLNFLGGMIGDEGMTVSGMPRVENGDEIILFTDPAPNPACPILGWSFGKFNVLPSSGGGKQVTAPVELNPTAPTSMPAAPDGAPPSPHVHSPTCSCGAETVSKVGLDDAERLVRSAVRRTANE